jgi:hypothetical protein
MRKLLIVPAILAMTCMSGSAFAQRNTQNAGSPVTANGSTVVPIGSPVTQLNVGVVPQISVLNRNGSGNQAATLQQSNQGNVGITGGNGGAQGVR